MREQTKYTTKILTIAAFLTGTIPALVAAEAGCWISGSSETFQPGLAKLGNNGTVLHETSTEKPIMDLSVNPVDGSLWTTETINYDDCWITKRNHEGTVLERNYIYRIRDIVGNALDNTCWVGSYHDTGDVYKVSPTLELTHQIPVWLPRDQSFPDSRWLQPNIRAIAANPLDGSCWLAVENSWKEGRAILSRSELVKLNANGSELFRLTDFGRINSLAVKPADGSCWVADAAYDEAPESGYRARGRVIKLSADGKILYKSKAFHGPISLSIDPVEDSCWFNEYDDAKLVKLTPDGFPAFELPEYSFHISVDPTDGSCWASTLNGNVSRISTDGTVLFTIDPPVFPKQMEVDPGKLYLGFHTIDHVKSNARLSTSGSSIQLQSDTEFGKRAKWTLTSLGNGSAYITNWKTGEKLVADSDEVHVKASATIDGPKAKWDIQNAGNDQVYLINKATGKMLSVANGENLILRNASSPGPNFRWTFANPQ